MRIAFLWNPALWVDRCHYIMEVYVRSLTGRGVRVLSVHELEGADPGSIDVLILESTSISIERHCFPKELVGSYNAFIGKIQRLVLCVHDLHDMTWDGGIAEFAHFIRRFGIRTLITKCHQNPEYKRLADLLEGHEFVHMFDPHSLPIDFQAPIRTQDDKLFDIFMFGNFQSWQGYVFRKRAHDIILTLPDVKLYHQEVGGSFSRSSYSNVLLGKDLIRLMSHSYLTLCTKTAYDYFVLKYVEAAAAGTVILGDIPSDASNLLSSDNFVAIDDSMTDVEISSRISEALILRTELYERGQALQRRFARKFTMGQRIDDVLSFLKRTDGDLGAIQIPQRKNNT